MIIPIIMIYFRDTFTIHNLIRQKVINLYYSRSQIVCAGDIIQAYRVFPDENSRLREVQDEQIVLFMIKTIIEKQISLENLKRGFVCNYDDDDDEFSSLFERLRV